MAHSTWSNLKYSESKKVSDLHKQIRTDPFSACFFLSSLYQSKKKEFDTKHPAPIPCSHEVASIRQELILIEMYMHIKTVQRNGLISLRKAI